MPALKILACLMCALSQVQSLANDSVGAIRFAHYEVLTQQFRSALDQSGGRQNQNTLQLTRQFVPKFLALAEENPDDEAAQRCCAWIIVHCRNHTSAPDLYEAEATCWKILATNQSASERIPALCVEAARYPTPPRERFLRALPQDYRQPVEVHGHAFLALAELLVKKREMKSLAHEFDERTVAESREYITRAEPAKLRQESAELYRHVQTHYAEILYVHGMQNDEECDTLGELATQRLSELESPRLVRKSLPNVIEMPAKRFEHLSRH